MRRVRDRAPVKLVGVMTAHHGRRLDKDGIDTSLALNLVESEGLGSTGPEDLKEFLKASEAEVMIECVPQNIRSGEPALTMLRTALDMGVSVVTANKSAVALGYRDLQHRAAKSNATFRFEATVLDGMPLFSLLSTMPETEVTKVRGVLNGTSSLVFEAVQMGLTRSRGLARAQAEGIAEADAVLDLDGWDAAAKAALLANVWMNGALRVVDVVRKGCETTKDERLREAGDGSHYRLVATVEKTKEGVVRAQVEPEALEPHDPFFSLKGSAGGITVETASGFAITLIQASHGLDDAAYGLVQDCWAIQQAKKA